MREYYKHHGNEGYILKCDVKKYFNSISHRVLHSQIADMKLDEGTKWLLNLIADSYEYSPERGIPMGNQTSQWFALNYLGFHFYLTDTGKVIRKLRQSGKKRMKRKMAAFKRLYKNNRITSEAVRVSLVSYNGHLKHGHTYHLRKNIISNLVLTRGKEGDYEQQ